MEGIKYTQAQVLDVQPKVLSQGNARMDGNAIVVVRNLPSSALSNPGEFCIAVGSRLDGSRVSVPIEADRVTPVASGAGLDTKVGVILPILWGTRRSVMVVQCSRGLEAIDSASELAVRIDVDEPHVDDLLVSAAPASMREFLAQSYSWAGCAASNTS